MLETILRLTFADYAFITIKDAEHAVGYADGVPVYFDVRHGYCISPSQGQSYPVGNSWYTLDENNEWTESD